MDKFLDKIGIDKYVRFNIIVFSIMAFITLSFGSLLMCLFGISYFALNYKDNFVLNEVISYIFMYLNCIMLLGIVFRIYNKSLFKTSLLYFIIQIVLYKTLIINHPYINLFTPLILIVIYCGLKKEFNLKIFKNLSFWYFIMLVFQIVELTYRMIFYSFVDYNSMTTYVEKFAILINLLMLQILIYLFFYMKEVIFNVELYSLRNTCKFPFNSKQEGRNELNQEDVEILEFYQSMTIGQRIYVSFIFCSVQILQILFVVFLCYLSNGKSGIINFVLILIVFWANRKIIGSDNSFHFDTFKHCTIFSGLVFLIAIKLAFQPYIWTFMSVLIGISIAVLFCILKFYSDRYKELEDKVGDLVDKENKE